MTKPTPEEKQFIDYLDELYPYVPISYGLLLFKGDPQAFYIAFNEWLDSID